MDTPIYLRKNATIGGLIKMPRHLSFGCVAALLMLSGCTTTSKDNTIPKDGPTLEQVYRMHMGERGGRGARFDADIPRRAAGDLTPMADRRIRSNEIENRFGRLPNPDLAMYVFPHLSGYGSRYPVPGYTTVFPMYETVEYAMPGERAPHEMFTQEPAYREGQASKRDANYHGERGLDARRIDVAPVVHTTRQRGRE